MRPPYRLEQLWKKADLAFATDLTYEQKMSRHGKDIYKIVKDAYFEQTLQKKGLHVVESEEAFKQGTAHTVLRLPHGQLAGSYLYYGTKYTLDTKLDAAPVRQKGLGLGSSKPALLTALE